MANRDWLPNSNEAILRMANTWVSYLTANVSRLLAPQDTINLLTMKKGEFDALLQTPPAARTPAMNAQLKATKGELKAMMRDIRRRHFFMPPLTESDIISLGLKMKDNTPTTIGVPVGLVTATVKYLHEGALELNIKHVEGTPSDSKANYGVKIRYAVFPLDTPSLIDVKLLTESKFTRRKKITITFDKNDARKTVYFCLRYENSKGETGQ